MNIFFYYKSTTTQLYSYYSMLAPKFYRQNISFIKVSIFFLLFFYTNGVVAVKKLFNFKIKIWKNERQILYVHS